MRSKVDHVVLNTKTTAFECHNCGSSYSMSLPAPISLMAAAAKSFASEHRRCPKPKTPFFVAEPIATTGSVDERAQRWINSGDTGLSSETIWRVFMSRGSGRADVPYDPSDFGRCHRLLKLLPEWRERLDKVAEALPEWGPLVREWSKLEAIYARDLPTGKSLELWKLMERLREEGVENVRKRKKGAT
jgi:hypothetical protein